MREHERQHCGPQKRRAKITEETQMTEPTAAEQKALDVVIQAAPEPDKARAELGLRKIIREMKWLAGLNDDE
jgi:hypothetical protein